MCQVLSPNQMLMKFDIGKSNFCQFRPTEHLKLRPSYIFPKTRLAFEISVLHSSRRRWQSPQEGVA